MPKKRKIMRERDGERQVEEGRRRRRRREREREREVVNDE
jgi:hypothetical protein